MKSRTMIPVGVVVALLCLGLAGAILRQQARKSQEVDDVLLGRWKIESGVTNLGPIVVTGDVQYIRVVVEQSAPRQPGSFSGRMVLVDPKGLEMFSMSGHSGVSARGMFGGQHPRSIVDEEMHAPREGEYWLRISGDQEPHANVSGIQLAVWDISARRLASQAKPIAGIDDAIALCRSSPTNVFAREYLTAYWARNANDQAAAAHLLTNFFLPKPVCESTYVQGEEGLIRFEWELDGLPGYLLGPYDFELGFVIDDGPRHASWRGNTRGSSGETGRLLDASEDAPGQHSVRTWCRFNWYERIDDQNRLHNKLWTLEWETEPVMFEVVAAAGDD